MRVRECKLSFNRLSSQVKNTDAHKYTTVEKEEIGPICSGVAA